MTLRQRFEFPGVPPDRDRDESPIDQFAHHEPSGVPVRAEHRHLLNRFHGSHPADGGRAGLVSGTTLPVQFQT